MNTYNWYSQLEKPTWSPPAWLFGPVWTALYAIIAVSFGIVFYKTFTKQIPWIVALPFALNLIFNFAFTPLQFGLKNNLLAAIDILLVFGTLIWALYAIWKARPEFRWVVYANLPYLLWVSFATVLQLTIVMQFPSFANEVQWNEAVAYGVILLAAGGFYELWLWLKTRARTYRIAFSVGLAGALLLGWVSGAVGIIGSENQPVNLMYWAVPAVLLIGSLISRFQPRGMARASFAVALVQVLVPVVALIISPEVNWGGAGVIGVFVFNSIFAVLFAGSGLLFLRAAHKENQN